MIWDIGVAYAPRVRAMKRPIPLRSFPLVFHSSSFIFSIPPATFELQQYGAFSPWRLNVCKTSSCLCSVFVSFAIQPLAIALCGVCHQSHSCASTYQIAHCLGGLLFVLIASWYAFFLGLLRRITVWALSDIHISPNPGLDHVTCTPQHRLSYF